MSYFSVAEMKRDEADEAYVLVRTLAPEITVRAWADFVASHIDRGGLLALRATGGGLFGLASYRIDDDVLLVENFLTIELSGMAPGRRQLAIALQQIAAARACTSVLQPIEAPREGGMLRNHLGLAAS